MSRIYDFVHQLLHFAPLLLLNLGGYYFCSGVVCVCVCRAFPTYDTKENYYFHVAYHTGPEINLFSGITIDKNDVGQN